LSNTGRGSKKRKRRSCKSSWREGRSTYRRSINGRRKEIRLCKALNIRILAKKTTLGLTCQIMTTQER